MGFAAASEDKAHASALGPEVGAGIRVPVQDLDVSAAQCEIDNRAVDKSCTIGSEPLSVHSPNGRAIDISSVAVDAVQSNVGAEVGAPVAAVSSSTDGEVASNDLALEALASNGLLAPTLDVGNVDLHEET